MEYERAKYFIKYEKGNQAAIHYKNIRTSIYCTFCIPFISSFPIKCTFLWPKIFHLWTGYSFSFLHLFIFLPFLSFPMKPTAYKQEQLFTVSLIFASPHIPSRPNDCDCVYSQDGPVCKHNWKFSESEDMSGKWVGAKLLLVNAGGQKMLAAW